MFFFGAAFLRAVRRHGGSARRTTPTIWREANRTSLHRQVSLARQGTALAACRRDYLVEAGAAKFLRRVAAGADMGLLASGAPHLPSPDPGPDVAPFGGPTRPGHLRTFRRRDVGRSRSDLLAKGSDAGWVIVQRGSGVTRSSNRRSQRLARRHQIHPCRYGVQGDQVQNLADRGTAIRQNRDVVFLHCF